MQYSKADLVNDLQQLGLMENDICVVRSALREIGDIRGMRSKIVLDALLDTVGPKGTLVFLTFTSMHKLPLDPDNVNHYFTENTEPYSGGLPKEALTRQGVIRSKHPTNSFCSLGPDATYLLENHDHNSSSYAPIGRVVEKYGKMLLIGALDTVPGFTSAHWAQWLLGYATKSRNSNKYGVYYYDNEGNVKLFIRSDIGGCSRGFDEFYKHYRAAGILSEGKIGNASSMLVNLAESLSIEMQLLQEDPGFILCGNPNCYDCRVGWEFSDTNLLVYKIRNRFRKLGFNKFRFKKFHR